MAYSPASRRAIDLTPHLHQPAEILHPDWLPSRRNREQLIATRKTLLPRFAAENAWLIPAHFRFPAVGRVQQDGKQYVWKPLSADRR